MGQPSFPLPGEQLIVLSRHVLAGELAGRRGQAAAMAEQFTTAIQLEDKLPYMEPPRSEEHTSELQSLAYLVCRLLLEKKNKHKSKERPDRTRRSHLTLPLRQAHTPPYRR